MVVAHQRDDAAMGRGSGVVGVAEHVAGAVDARTLAVPDAEHAVIGALAMQFGLLRAPKRRRGQVFVEARLKQDIARFQPFAGAQKGLVNPAERRAAIACYIAGGVEAVCGVHRALRQRQADHGLSAGNIDALLGEIIFIVEANLGESHGTPLS